MAPSPYPSLLIASFSLRCIACVMFPFNCIFIHSLLLGTVLSLSSHGAALMVDAGGVTDPLEIARMELSAGKIPIVIRRYLPNGNWEDWSVDELNID